MKTLVVGDPHFKDNNEEETNLLNSEIERLIEEEDIDEIIVLGDVNDRFKLLSLSRAKHWLIHISSLRPTILLIGNHERLNNTDFHSPVHHFVGLDSDRLKIVWKSERIGDCLYVPYVDNGRFAESVELAGGAQDVRFIFAHQSFVGCGEPNAKDEWKSSTRIISGHIHYNRVLHKGVKSSLEGKWNVYYPGAPLCSNFGDAHERFLCIVEGTTVKQVPIKAIVRSVITFTADFDDDTITAISKADKYTKIELVGSHEDTLAMSQSRSVEEARRRGALVITQRPREDIPRTIEGKSRTTDSFATRLVDRLGQEDKWSVDELDELSKLLRE